MDALSTGLVEYLFADFPVVIVVSLLCILDFLDSIDG